MQPCIYPWDYTINHNENKDEKWKIDHIETAQVDLNYTINHNENKDENEK